MVTPADTYRTIRSVSKGIFRDKGSKFIAFAVPVKTLEEVKGHIDELRIKFHDARHHCYAYVLGSDKGTWRINDDGEPSGSAGRPILGQINSNDLTNVLIVVTRYFGGTLLGISGLINAYRSAAAEALENAEIIEGIVTEFYRLSFPYSSMNDVMKILKDENIIQSEQVFELTCSIKVGIRLSLKESLVSRLESVRNLDLEYIGPG